MIEITIDKQRCINCECKECISVCDRNVYEIYNNKLIINIEKCSGIECGQCVYFCPNDAIILKNNLSTLGDELLYNGHLALSEGLKCWENAENGNVNQYRFAILHFIRSIELILKYLVWTLHPLLIYKKPYEQKIDTAFTITPQEAFFILRNSDVESFDFHQKEIVSNDELAPFIMVKKIRNSFEHLPVKINFLDEKIKQDIRKNIVSILKTIEHFSYIHRAAVLDTFDNADLLSDFME